MTIPLMIHATHEAGAKIGGIGAVLDGMLGVQSYLDAVERTVLAGPLYGYDTTFMERMVAPRSGMRINYSSLHGIFNGVDENTRAALQSVEETYQVGVLYGVRRFGQAEHEVLLVDASNPNQKEFSDFRYHLWNHYGIDSANQEWNPEYNFQFAIAQPLLAALNALGIGANLPANKRFMIAHEWLGMPLVFAAQLNNPDGWTNVFYAHETATARRLVEDHAGHDTRFYNIKWMARQQDMNLDDVFGNQDGYFKHLLLKRAGRTDVVLAVGDLVVDELRFLGDSMTDANIRLAYNGVNSKTVTLSQKKQSKHRLQTYCQNLLDYKPDYVFTHVTRLVPSKALWRDARVLWHINERLAERDERAVLFVLSTQEAGGRKADWVHAWEEQYGWPVGHRGDNGDLIGAEEDFFFHVVEPFNRDASHCQIVFVNQFGWSQDRCGLRMPADMEFPDIRLGSDLEFGQSIYEPFGIAQVEALESGALCCVSNVCGCVGFVRQAAQQAQAAGSIDNLTLAKDLAAETIGNLIIADYVTPLAEAPVDSLGSALAIDGGFRDNIETNRAKAVADTICALLPTSDDEMEELLTVGQAISQNMSWDVVVTDYFLPALTEGS